MDSKKYIGPSEEWLAQTDAIEETCLSVAAAGLAAELGMVDRDLIRQSRAAMEASDAAPRPIVVND
jgi:hypothetical protein